MSHFACIYFNEANILLSKVEVKQNDFLGAGGYDIYMPVPMKEMKQRAWEKLEYQLQDLDVEYVVMDTKENPFQEVQLVNGELLKRYLSVELLHYIYKYELIKKNKLYVSVGIIAGRVDESLDVAISLLDEVTSLTFFMNQPDIYKDVISEIYDNYRLKAKAKVPCSSHLKEMDIIFDLVGNYHYAKWCKPKAIYIDLKNYISRKDVMLEGLVPIIWHDFDIRCGRQQRDIACVQAAFYAQGIFKGSFLKAMKRMNISIDTVYSTRIS